MDTHPLSERSFRHHLGHGLGHLGHEASRIIPGSEEVFEGRDVFTLEPGIYCTAMQGGIRLENSYVLGDTGPLNFFDYPLGL